MAGSDLPPLPILLCSPGPGLGYTTASYILPVGCLLPAELQAIPWPQAQPTSPVWMLVIHCWPLPSVPECKFSSAMVKLGSLVPGTCTSSENMKEMGRTVTERQKGYRGEACRAVSPSVTPQLVRLQGWRGTGGAMGRPRKFRSNLSCTHSLAPLWDCSCPAELPKTRLSGPCAKGVPTARDAWRHTEDLEVDQGGTQAGGTTLGGDSSVPRHCLSRGESASRVVRVREVGPGWGRARASDGCPEFGGAPLPQHPLRWGR